MYAAESAPGVHLVVLQHGLWGHPCNLAALHEHLEATLHATAGPERVVIENSVVNGRRRTHDGIDTCGDRLVRLVLARTAQLGQDGHAVVKLSLLGYSLGGLICRYAVGKLYALGYFDSVQPVNFVTIATPHLGSFREPDGLWARMFNAHVPLIASRSGHQLMLLDRKYPLPGSRAGGDAAAATEDHRPRQAAPPQLHKQGQVDQGSGGGASVRAGGVGAVRRRKGVPLRAQHPTTGWWGVPSMPGTGGSIINSHANNSSSSANIDSGVSAGGGAGKRSAGALAGAPASQRRRQQQHHHQQHHHHHHHHPHHHRGGALEGRLVPLLVLMAHPGGPFLAGLARFKRRVRVANIKNDVSVPYCTAAMALTNPYLKAHPVPTDPRYPSVVRPALEGEAPPAARPPPLVGYGLYAFLLLSPVLLPLLPALYLAYVSSTLMHHWRAAALAPDARWVAEHPLLAAQRCAVAGAGSAGAAAGAGVMQRLGVVGRLVSGDLAAAAAELVMTTASRRRSLEATSLGLGLGLRMALGMAGDYHAEAEAATALPGPAACCVSAAAADFAAGRRCVEVERAPAVIGPDADADDGAAGEGGSGGVVMAAVPPALLCTYSTNKQQQQQDSQQHQQDCQQHQHQHLNQRHRQSSSGTASGGGGSCTLSPLAMASARPAARAASRLGAPCLACRCDGSGLQGLLRALPAVQPPPTTCLISGKQQPASPGAHPPVAPAASSSPSTGDGAAAAGGLVGCFCGAGAPSSLAASDGECLVVRGSGPLTAAGDQGGGDGEKAAAAPAAAEAEPATAAGAQRSAAQEVAAAAAAAPPDDADAAQLRRALDSVRDSRRRAILSGMLSGPEGQDGAALDGGFGEQQAWIAKQLRRLEWLHVDADVGHVRSHAAVINRDKMFPGLRHDVMQFVTDHWVV